MSLLLAQQRKFKEQGRTSAADPAEGKRVLITGGGHIGAQQLATMLNDSLEEDLLALKDYQSIQRKIEFKKNELIPKYKGYVERLKASGQNHSLLGYYLVWLLDAGEMDEAVPYGLYCVKNGVSMPERFQSELKTFFVGEVCKWAADLLEGGKSADPYLFDVFEAVTVGNWDIADSVCANLYRCVGFQFEQAGEIEQAVEYLGIALSMGAQVKTRLKELRKKLK